MLNFSKKIIPVTESQSYLNRYGKKIKGVISLSYVDDEFKITVAFSHCDFSTLDDYSIFISDGEKTVTRPLLHSYNFTVSIDDLKLDKNFYFIIARDDNVAAYAPKQTDETKIINLLKIDDATPYNQTKYDDEAVATENYYENEHNLYDQNVDFKTGYLPKKEEIIVSEKFNDDEKNVSEVEKHYFFSANDGKLSSLLKKYPKEKSLTAILPSSDFVLINYDANKRYVVGTTIINGVQYYCFGVEGTIYDTPVKNSVFVPSSFSNDKKGYFIIFQNAKSGKTATFT